MNKKYKDLSKDQLIEEIDRLRREFKKRKKYGLVWEDNPEDVVEQCKNELPVLEQVSDNNIKTSSDLPTNLLIEGDNYHALSVLNYTHKGKIDVIYIDPPYNTGASDWKYNNNYVDINDRWRHSKWISFMKNRLAICNTLIKKDGVIIIAIDDNEFATLSLLLDELYPNKVKNNVVIVNNPHGVSRSGFSRTHEYAIFLLNPGQVINKKAVPEDIREINLRRSGNNSLRQDSPTMFYPILVDKKTLKIIDAGSVPSTHYHPSSQNIEKDTHYEIWPLDSKGIEKNWYYSRKRVAERGSIELFTKRVKGQINVYFHHSNNSEQTYKSVWTGSEYDAGSYGSTLVKNMIGSNFPFPKSINNVYDCLRAVIKSKNAIVLDFFAGSGTTAHAVLQMNQLDGGSRQFILCTNNEGNIARDICYPRVKKIIEGYSDVKGIPANLRYFKTSFVKKSKVSDDTRRELIKRSTEMICVKENTFDSLLDTEKYKMFRDSSHITGILFDLDEIDTFEKRLNEQKLPASIYVFSLTKDTYNDDFEDLDVDHELCPIPESILEVYKKLFK